MIHGNHHAHAGALHGVLTALITPWLDDQSVDWATLEAYIHHPDHQALSGWVVAGTTGEGMLLSDEEYGALIKQVKAWCPDKVVMAGVTGLTAATMVEKMVRAQEAGADFALVLTPYYIKPSQDALVALWTQLHHGCSLPMVAYHNPGRTGVSLEIDTLLRLADIPSVVGVKDSTHDMARPLQLRAALQGKPWALLCGEDDMFLPYTASGGSGIISVQSGLVPQHYAHVWKALTQGNIHQAQELAWALAPLHQSMKHAANPVSVKSALAALGWGKETLRAPVGRLTPAQIACMVQALAPLQPVVPPDHTLAAMAGV